MDKEIFLVTRPEGWPVWPTWSLPLDTSRCRPSPRLRLAIFYLFFFCPANHAILSTDVPQARRPALQSTHARHGEPMTSSLPAGNAGQVRPDLPPPGAGPEGRPEAASRERHTPHTHIPPPPQPLAASPGLARGAGRGGARAAARGR